MKGNSEEYTPPGNKDQLRKEEVYKKMSTYH